MVALLPLSCAPEPPPDAETVILVHGLARTPASMAILQARLTGEGYRVVNFGYPSTSEEIESLVDSLEVAVQACCSKPGTTVHFVTHSMGGILVRAFMEDRDSSWKGRVVMLSPPNQGSEVIDAFKDTPLLRAIVGPAGAELGTDSSGIAQQLPPVDFSLGIITGDRSISPIGSLLIPGPDDGKVSVESANLPGSDDFMVVPATHTFIMNRADVAEEIVHFLRTGAFSNPGGAEDETEPGE
jgi:pimeloyl-ACP methyl ester carboxylesterase